MTVTAQSWANMTSGQQTFWIYFYVFAVLFLGVVPAFALAFLHLTDPEPALQFRELQAWFRERRWHELLPARPPDRTAGQAPPPRAAAVAAALPLPPCGDADWPRTPAAPVAGVRGTTGGYR